MKKYLISAVIIILVALVSVLHMFTRVSSKPIRVEMFNQLNQFVSKDFNFSYMEIDSSKEYIKIRYSAMGEKSKKTYLRLEFTEDIDEKAFHNIVQEKGLDKIQTAKTEINQLTHEHIVDVFEYAIKSESCLKKYTDENNNLKSGNMSFGIADNNKIDLTYVETGYIGASAVCAFLLVPLKEVESTLMIQ